MQPGLYDNPLNHQFFDPAKGEAKARACLTARKTHVKILGHSMPWLAWGCLGVKAYGHETLSRGTPLFWRAITKGLLRGKKPRRTQSVVDSIQR